MRAFQVVGLPLLKPIGKDGSALSVVVNKALIRQPPEIVSSICAELLCRIDCVPQPNHALGP